MDRSKVRWTILIAVPLRDELLRLKRNGAPILNGEAVLNAWPNHFRRKSATRGHAVPGRHAKLFHPLRRPFGSVLVFFKPIGNVRTQTAREIWYGKDGAERRKETIACETLCLFTCLSQKNLGDKIAMGMKLIRPRKTPTVARAS